MRLLRLLRTAAARRGFVYEGQLRPLGRRGLPFESVFAYLCGDLLLFTKPLDAGGGKKPARAATRRYQCRILCCSWGSTSGSRQNVCREHIWQRNRPHCVSAFASLHAKSPR